MNIQKFRNNRYSFITKLDCNAVTDPLVNTSCVMCMYYLKGFFADCFQYVKKVRICACT